MIDLFRSDPIRLTGGVRADGALFNELARSDTLEGVEAI
jgi:hypothetical protein